MAVTEEEAAEAITCKLLDAVSTFGGHTNYWRLLLSCFPPPHQQAAASSSARSTSSTSLPVLLEKFGVLTQAKPLSEGNSTPPTIQQCVAEDINGVGFYLRACIIFSRTEPNCRSAVHVAESSCLCDTCTV